MLEDNTSKFGTLVLVKQRTPLLPGYNKAVQVGRTVINFSVKSLQKPDSSVEKLVIENEVMESNESMGPIGKVTSSKPI